MKKNKHDIRLKIPIELYSKMLSDLQRPHSYAYERVGFLFTNSKQFINGVTIITATEYIPVNDENYIEDNSVGAKINSRAIREAMQRMLNKKEGCFHVHLHNHSGTPNPSSTDNKWLPPVIESFCNISSQQANGILILSRNSFYSSIKLIGENHFIKPKMISVIGYPMMFVYPQLNTKKNEKMFDRQSFLGENSQFLFENVRVGIIGYGGGGSHMGQQLAHLGVKKIIVFDDDKVEDTNLNRLIGSWFRDIKKALLKTEVAKRVIKKILPTAKLICINDKWQNKTDLLQQCDIVIGCVDTYSNRQQLEAECRRFLIPYIDIGMDIYKVENEPPSMSGQIILSMPGLPCMSCYGFLTENKLAQEAAKYGNVGGRPQVVWPNGVLASTAVGILVDLITGWTKQNNKLVYLSYDGNKGVLENHVRLKYVNANCSHYPLERTGSVKFVRI